MILPVTQIIYKHMLQLQLNTCKLPDQTKSSATTETLQLLSP